MKRKKLEKSAFLALQILRKKEHKEGHPFMINSSKLPVDQCYLEYPNGSIEVVTMCHNSKDFKVIREPSPEEQNSIKKALKLA